MRLPREISGGILDRHLPRFIAFGGFCVKQAEGEMAYLGECDL